jgi:hypothetical protein
MLAEAQQTHQRPAWNTGRIIGPKPPLKPRHIWAIRTRLQHEHRVRDLAMFNLAIDSKLRGCDCAAVLGRQRAEAAAQAREPLREFIADLRTIYFDWPFLAATEVLVTARTAPELMASLKPVLERFHAGMKAVWLEAFVAAGYEPGRAETLLALTLNLIRGMAINRIWQHDQASYERLIEDWCQREAATREAAAGGEPERAAAKAGSAAPQTLR